MSLAAYSFMFDSLPKATGWPAYRVSSGLGEPPGPITVVRVLALQACFPLRGALLCKDGTSDLDISLTARNVTRVKDERYSCVRIERRDRLAGR